MLPDKGLPSKEKYAEWEPESNSQRLILNIICRSILGCQSDEFCDSKKATQNGCNDTFAEEVFLTICPKLEVCTWYSVDGVDKQIAYSSGYKYTGESNVNVV